MGEELDRMMGLRKWSIVFLVLLIIAIVLIVSIIIFMNVGDYSGTNNDFNKVVAVAELDGKTIELENFSKLYFFSQSHKNQRTLFKKVIPNLKIINSQEYKIEITSNSDILSMLDITLEDNALFVDFKQEHYHNVSRMGRTYKGLYVDCAKFDITVYAPINYLVSDAEFNVDFEAPKAQTFIVLVNGEISDGRIYDVDAEVMGVFLSGNSNASVSGEVREYTELLVKHSSRLDASELNTPVINDRASSQLFGISSIKYKDRVKYSINDLGFILSVAIVFAVLIVLAGFIVLRVLFLKQKKELDQFIAQVEKEGNFLQIPKKTDKNLLQNGE
ncbi:MAG: DUF2807 domain-containing protein [Clostridia bacterium]|nr:DUF2807 domain-containing protein [Clostridia bacterium]